MSVRLESGQARCGALTAIKETTVRRRGTDGVSLTVEEDRMPPSLPGPQKTSQAGTGLRLKAISEHTK